MTKAVRTDKRLSVPPIYIARAALIARSLYIPLAIQPAYGRL